MYGDGRTTGRFFLELGGQAPQTLRRAALPQVCANQMQTKQYCEFEKSLTRLLLGSRSSEIPRQYFVTTLVTFQPLCLKRLCGQRGTRPSNPTTVLAPTCPRFTRRSGDALHRCFRTKR